MSEETLKRPEDCFAQFWQVATQAEEVFTDYIFSVLRIFECNPGKTNDSFVTS